MVPLVLMLASALAVPSAPACAYSDELPQYRLCAVAAWSSLRPLVSTLADVRAILGTPTYEWDMAAYHVPYPGDEAARKPVLGFDDGGLWKIQVKLVRTNSGARSLYPSSLHDRLLSIDLIPRPGISFAKVVFPASFVKHHVVEADTAQDEYRHPSGLVYTINVSRIPYGDYQVGDLIRISYGVSDEARRTYVCGVSNFRLHLTACGTLSLDKKRRRSHTAGDAKR